MQDIFAGRCRLRELAAITQEKSKGRKMTPNQRGLMKLLFLVVYLFSISFQAAYAKALTTAYGPLEVDAGWNYYSIADGVYQRYDYPYVGAIIRMQVQKQQNPDDGDIWTVSIDDKETGQRLGTGRITYDGASDCFLFEGTPWYCGIYVPDDSDELWWYWFSVVFNVQCLPTRDYLVAVEFLGNDVGDSPWPFRPIDFGPDTPSVTVYPSSINPYILRTEQAGNPKSIIPETKAGESTVYIRVKDDLGCNQVLPDIKVDIKNTIVEQSGSHIHFQSAGELGTGEYTQSTPAWSNIEDNNTKIITKTNQYGLVRATYKAGEYGVAETVEVTAYHPETSEKKIAEDTLTIKVPNLVPLDTSGETYTLAGTYVTKCDKNHNDGPTARHSHYVTPPMYQLVKYMDDRFSQEFGYHLSFNDASLEYGGLFDVDRESRCHWTHREGVDIDVNVGGEGACPDSYNLNCPADPTVNLEFRRKDFLEQIVTSVMGGYKWREGPLHYRFHFATNNY